MPDLLVLREDLLDGGNRWVCEHSPPAGGRVDIARDSPGDDVSLLSMLQERMAGAGKRSRTRNGRSLNDDRGGESLWCMQL